MRAFINNEQFCDLFCYCCDCYRLRSCLMFGFEAPFYSDVLIYIAEHKIFNDFNVKGFWAKHISVSAEQCDKDLKFPAYETEICH